MRAQANDLTLLQPTPAKWAGPTNALTIDVEDYFQVSAFNAHIPRLDWNLKDCRIEANLTRILALLARYEIKATFFTLGWIAERYPALIRQVVAQGHELASHGYGHERVSAQTPAAFAADIELAKCILEDLAACEVKGYRAPSFSLGTDTPWAYDALARAGYRYSSSTYPIRHDHYGQPDAPRFAHPVRPGLTEIPISSVRLLNHNLPCGGGGYFRLYPYAVSRWMLRRVNAQEQQAAVFYFHPWELDAAQPRVAGISRTTRFRHYLNLQHMEQRLTQLLGDFKWGRMDQVFMAAEGAHAAV